MRESERRRETEGKKEIPRKTAYKSGITSSGYLFQWQDLVSVVGGNAVGNNGNGVGKG